MFGLLKKKETESLKIELPPLEEDGEKEIICSPLEGTVVPCSQIKDLTFQDELLGPSVAVKPSAGKVYAPADGKINMMIETLHAISMTTDHGAEILIHVGIDTVALKGKHFKGYVKEGNVVKRGDLLLEFNLEAIEAAGYDMTSPIILCNAEEYTMVEKTQKEKIVIGETILKLTK